MWRHERLRYCGVGDEYKAAVNAVADALIRLMGEMPSHSILLVTSDHGHEDGGGAGGSASDVRKVPLYVYHKTVEFGASSSEAPAPPLFSLAPFRAIPRLSFCHLCREDSSLALPVVRGRGELHP